MKFKNVVDKLGRQFTFLETGLLRFFYDPVKEIKFNQLPNGKKMIEDLKNGIVTKLSEDDKITYIRNKDGLEMWLNDKEELIRARWANGYEQYYQDGNIYILSEAYK